MEIILFITTLTCGTIVAFNLCVVELTNTLNMEAIIAIMDIWAMLGLTFAYFYLAEWITSDQLEVGVIFYNSPWYQLSIKHQKLLALPIQRAASELRLKCFNLFECSLLTFSAVSVERIR